MATIYLEDIVKIVGNKYLAVNMASQRARQLNEKGLSILSPNMRKPAPVAIEELVEGQIVHRSADSTTQTSDDLLIFNGDIDDAVEPDDDLEDMKPEYYAEEADVVVDPDEREEGL